MGLEPMGYTAANRRTIKLMVEQAAPLFEDGSAPMFMVMADAIAAMAVGKLFYAIAPEGAVDPDSDRDVSGEKRLYLRTALVPFFADQGEAASPASRPMVTRAAAVRNGLNLLITAPDASPLTETSFDVDLGDAANDNNPLRIKTVLIGETLAGTPGAAGSAEQSYRNAVELTQDYLFIDCQTGWNNNTGDNNGRTGIYASRRKLVHRGQGDLAAYNASVFLTSTKPGATHWLANPAGVIINGTVAAAPGARGNYLNPGEWLLKDTIGSTEDFTATITTGSDMLTDVVGTLEIGDVITGAGIPTGAYVATKPTATSATLKRQNASYQQVAAAATATTAGAALKRQLAEPVSCIGWVVNMERHRDAGPGPNHGGTGIGTVWSGFRAQSRGSVPADSAFSAIGRYRTGLNLSAPNLEFENKDAVSIRPNDRIYLNATGWGLDTDDVYMRENWRHTAGFGEYLQYDDVTQQIQIVVANNVVGGFSSGQLSVPRIVAPEVTLTAGGKVFIGGLTIVGGRTTGWTRMTGTLDKTSAFDTASITHEQLARRVMAIEAALHISTSPNGLIGA